MTREERAIFTTNLTESDRRELAKTHQGYWNYEDGFREQRQANNILSREKDALTRENSFWHFTLLNAFEFIGNSEIGKTNNFNEKSWEDKIKWVNK